MTSTASDSLRNRADILPTSWNPGAVEAVPHERWVAAGYFSGVEEIEGESVSLRYGSLDDDEPHVIVATTRVETMLGDTTVAEGGRLAESSRR